MDLREILRQGLTLQKSPFDENKLGQLIKFIELLEKWNSVYNLTAIRDKPSMVSRHLLDSLTLEPFLQAFSNIATLAAEGECREFPWR